MKVIKGVLECSTCPKGFTALLDWTPERKREAERVVRVTKGAYKMHEVPFSCSVCMVLACAEAHARLALSRLD